MARVENKNGLFIWSAEERRWMCSRTRNPMQFRRNTFVPTSYSQTLTREYVAGGGTASDLGFEEPKPKRERKVKVKAPRTRKPKVPKMFRGMEIVDLF